MHIARHPPAQGAAESPVRRIILVAGETSGDQLGAALLLKLKQRYPQAEFAGIGGPMMREAGLDCWWDCSELAVMGLAEVLRHLRRILSLRRDLIRRSIAYSPDCYIGIDAPDFNLGVEKRLKRRGINTVHYVSPSIWAWRRKRAAKIGRSTDLVLCLFPFEPELYARYQVNAKFVGHPLADQMPLSAARQADDRTGSGPLVAVLPGSRISEVQRLGVTFANAVSLLKQQRPELRFVSPAATPATGALFARQLDAAGAGGYVDIRNGESQQVLIASNIVMLASGTAALEALLANRPMVVGYRIASLSWIIVRFFGLLKVKHFSLPNALTSKPLVPELMQDDFRAKGLADEVLALLDNPDRASAMTTEFGRVHRALRRDGAGSAASAIAGLLEASK